MAVFKKYDFFCKSGSINALWHKSFFLTRGYGITNSIQLQKLHLRMDCILESSKNTYEPKLHLIHAKKTDQQWHDIVRLISARVRALIGKHASWKVRNRVTGPGLNKFFKSEKKIENRPGSAGGVRNGRKSICDHIGG